MSLKPSRLTDSMSTPGRPIPPSLSAILGEDDTVPLSNSLRSGRLPADTR